MNLIKRLQAKINRSRKLLDTYKTIPAGALGTIMIEIDIKDAEDAIANGDTVKMIRLCEILDDHK